MIAMVHHPASLVSDPCTRVRQSVGRAQTSLSHASSAHWTTVKLQPGIVDALLAASRAETLWVLIGSSQVSFASDWSAFPGCLNSIAYTSCNVRICVLCSRSCCFATLPCHVTTNQPAAGSQAADLLAEPACACKLRSILEVSGSYTLVIVIPRKHRAQLVSSARQAMYQN